MPHTFSAASLEPVLVPVDARRDGATVDPTENTVQMAFLDEPPETASPESGDWKTASWETNPTTDPDRYEAKCLVGTGGAVVLAAGTWYVWVKVTDSPDIPVKYSGVIRITP
jgi:hypothetical protein